MKALTVQQPWAWAIIHGGKDVENRTQAWGYRGPLAIHAGARFSDRSNDALIEALGNAMRDGRWKDLEYSAIIGVVDLADVHVAATGCCESEWGEQQYDEHGGRTRRDIVHLELANARPLPEPIPCKGSLGLWTPPADLLDQLQAVAR